VSPKFDPLSLLRTRWFWDKTHLGLKCTPPILAYLSFIGPFYQSNHTTRCETCHVVMFDVRMSLNLNNTITYACTGQLSLVMLLPILLMASKTC